MTLHEAIKTVLEEVGRALTSKEIAEIINKKDLYQRKDGRPVSSNQITARIANHTDIFFRREGKNYLIKEDEYARTYRLFRTHINQRINYLYNSGRREDVMNELIDVLHQLAQTDLIEYAEKNNLKLPISLKSRSSETSFKFKFQIIFQTCNWFLSQFARQGVFKEEWADFLYKLDLFKNSENKLLVESGFYSHFLLKLPIWTSSKYKIEDIHTTESSFDYQVNAVNKELFEAINFNPINRVEFKNEQKIAFFIPPIGPVNPVKLEGHLNNLMTEIETGAMKLDGAILILPSGFLNSRSKKINAVRKTLVDSGKLDKVIGVGSIMEHSSVHLSVLMFDFHKTNSKTLFVDPNQLLNSSPSLSEIVNSELIINEISSSISKDQIIQSNYNLSPFFYTTDVQEISKNEEGVLKSISDLILEGKKGTTLRNRKKLYKGGEFKFVRVPDLNSKNLFFNSSDSTLGIDSDELPDRSLIKNYGVVLSTFNNNIKANILKGKEKYLIDQNLIWIDIDQDQILEEFFLLELKKEYVKKQIESYSGGMTIARLSYSDLKSLKIRVPSLEVQKEKIIALLKNEEKINFEEELNDLEVDFIKTLKHTIKQPTSTLSNDFSILRDYLIEKSSNNNGINESDTLVKIFKDDSKEFTDKFKLKSTLDRIERSITSIDYIVDQAVQLISLNQIEKQEVKIKDWLKRISSDYNHIDLKILGPNLNVFVDLKQLKILIDNFVQNAIRHGFIDNFVSNSEVLIEIEDQNPLTFNLKIRNNGKPLPPEFTIEDFLAKGASSKEDVGSGFGGFLIGKIVKNHGGSVILGDRESLKSKPHNVEFVVSLPK